MTAVDRRQLLAEIAVRYGVRIDENDPVFIVASLSERALEAASWELVQKIDESLKKFEAAVERTQTRAGKYLGAECREQVTAKRSQLEGDIWAAGARAGELVEQVHRVYTRAALIRWISVGAFSALLLFGTGVWVGAYCL